MRRAERNYEAKADNGRDFVAFTFYSSHRAGSKENFEDASRTYKRKHGHSIKILDTTLVPDDYQI